MNEEMKVAELMKPRIMCVEPFLGMKREGWELNLISTIEVGEDYQFLMSLPVKYPLNFKLLPWWSHRTLEEMPGYVKCTDSQSSVYFGVHKVLSWEKSKFPAYCIIELNNFKLPLCGSVVPATLHDYEQYTNHKTV